MLARTDRLTQDARQAIEIAAVIGRRSWRQVLAGLVEATTPRPVTPTR